MASLLSSSSLKTGGEFGNASASSLIKSAQSLENEMATFQDTEAQITYENSAKTAADLQNYTSYLNGRITTLQSTGTITDATKAMTMQQTLVSATHANISADIQRENINLMSQGMGGTASGYQQKMGVVSDEYSRALSIGDDALAQSLMSQYYSLSQSYQNAVSTAASASSTLSKASSSSGTPTADELIANLKGGLTYLEGLGKDAGSEQELNQKMSDYANQQKTTLNALGVNIGNATPNYFDVVYGVVGAIYNARVLQAQSDTNPITAASYAQDAANITDNESKYSTLAGNLSIQQIAQASQDHKMLSFDSSTGTYKPTVQSGWQYMNLPSAGGGTSNQLVPEYSGYVRTKQANQITFLSPTQTIQMTKLGLDFTENISGKSVENTSTGRSGTTGNGVEVQLTASSPQWLKNILNQGGITNMYLSPDTGGSTGNGYLTFKGASTDGQGESIYTIATDSKGLHGLYQQTPDGSYHLTGGDYGFDASAVNLLLGQAQQQAYTVGVEQAQEQAKLQAAQVQAQKLAQVSTVPVVKAAAPPPSQAQRLQPAASPQFPTYNPQGNNVNPQGSTANPQQTVNGFNLNQSGSGGIKLNGGSGSAGIKL